MQRTGELSRSSLYSVASVLAGAVVLAGSLLASGCKIIYDATVSLDPRPRARGLAAATLAEVLALPEEEIDIGRAALLVAREDRPELRVDEYLRRLDGLAARLRRRLPEGTTVRDAVRELVLLVQPSGRAASALSGTTVDGAEGAFPPGLDIARILDGSPGNCLGIGLLYLAAAERVGLPLRGVSAPEHFFVRFDDGVWRENIEPTRGGARVSDDAYRRLRRISREAVDAGIYLRSESKRQVIASLLANRAGYRALAGRLDEALEDAERALAVKPYWPQAYVNRGLVNGLAGRPREAEADYHEALKRDPNCAGALNNLAELYVRSWETVRKLTIEITKPAENDQEAPSACSAVNKRRLGSIETAARMIAKALKIAPGRPEFHETAASVAAARGKPGAARRHLRRARRLDPDNPRYARLLEEIESPPPGGCGKGWRRPPVRGCGNGNGGSNDAPDSRKGVADERAVR